MLVLCVSRTTLVDKGPVLNHNLASDGWVPVAPVEGVRTLYSGRTYWISRVHAPLGPEFKVLENAY